MIPPGYHGFDWPGFWYVDAPAFTRNTGASVYEVALVSGTQVAFNVNGASPSITSLTPFDLNSAYFTAVWQAALQLEVRGFVAGTLAYDNTYELNSTGPTFLDFSYFRVDEVDFIPSGGGNQWFAMDNLQVNAVPEPSTLALVALGLAAAASASLRRPTSSSGPLKNGRWVGRASPRA
jgi:hypothetical protein